MSADQPAFTLRHKPALDGLRGIAVLLVMAAHAHLPIGEGATVGVTLFFVLSGYLITTILRAEHHTTGLVNFRRFYARRARRLLPALAFLLIVVTAFLVNTGQSLLPVALSAGYVSNIAAATGYDPVWLKHTWTLSMEEQFYLAWPLLLALVVRRRPVLILLLAASASAALRTGLWLNGATLARVYYGPDVRVEAILIGCALAFVKIPTCHLKPAAALCFLALAVGCATTSMQQIVWFLTPATLAMAVILAWAIHHEPRFLAFRPLVGIGKISYGLYLWHFPAAVLVQNLTASLVARTGMMVAFTFVMAILSWFLIERPFMRRSMTGASPQSVAVLTPPAIQPVHPSLRVSK